MHAHLSRFPPRAPPPHSCVCFVVSFSWLSIRWSFLHVFLLIRISFVPPAYPLAIATSTIPLHVYHL
jgi:hypothetical protein